MIMNILEITNTFLLLTRVWYFLFSGIAKQQMIKKLTLVLLQNCQREVLPQHGSS